MRKNLLALLVLVCSMVFFTGKSFSQISFTTIGEAYTQNFDFWGHTSDTIFITDNSSFFPGFYSYRSAGNTQPQIFRTNRYPSASYYGGGHHNYGHDTDKPDDRACVLIYASASGPLSVGFRFKNNTGTTITSLEVSFYGEQWGVGNKAEDDGTTSVQSLFFDYLQAPEVTSLSLPGYIRVPALEFVSPNTSGKRRSINGNLPANRTLKAAALDVTIPPGEEIMLRWIDDVDDPNFDHRMGLDDLVVIPRAATTSSEIIGESSGLKIYPNPVGDILTIDARQIGGKKADLFDMTGRRVMMGHLLNDGFGELNIAGLKAGMFTVEVETVSGKIFSARLIKK